MQFGLIVIGDEILSGKRRDQHLPKVIELLGARGLALGWARFVGDDPARITADLADAFEGARARGDIVFSCGGIGATPDDHTRAAAARALGRPLALHPQAHALIVERTREIAVRDGLPFDPAAPDHVHRTNMAVFPEGADIIPNPYNRIAGFSVRAGDGGVYFVPGFPVMAEPMIAWVLDTVCVAMHQKKTLTERSVIVFGAMEAALTPLMLEIESAFTGIKVFSLPSVDHPQWGRHIELGVKGHAAGLDDAYAALLDGLRRHGAGLGPEMVR